MVMLARRAAARWPRSLAARGALLLGAAQLGCFDVHEVDTSGTPMAWPRVRVVDDFESANGLPTWNRLNPWICDTWPAPGACVAGSVEPEPGGQGRAGFLAFDVTGPGGAQLSADTLVAGLDLGRYDELVFTARLEAREEGSLPPSVEVRVKLICPNAAEVGFYQNESVSVMSAGSPLSDGPVQRFVLRLATMTQPTWQEWERIDPRRCLADVSALAFEIDAVEGVSLAGTLTVDDVELYDYAGGEPSSANARFSPWYCVGGPGIACDASREIPTATFPDASEPELPNRFCTDAVKVEPTAHTLGADTRNFGSLASLSFAANFAPTDSGTTEPARFAVRLGCSTLAPGFPAVVREIELLPHWSSYELPIASFVPYSWPIGFDNVEGCLEQIDQLCLEVPRGTTPSAGTLMLDELVLR
jgi:hypothetical protein